MIVAAVHTAMAMVDPTKELFSKYLPDIRLISIVDESLIQDVISAGKVPDAVKKRLINYYYSAVDANADMIFSTCSSVGEIASLSRNFIPIPIVRIDEAMVNEAISSAENIGVLATLPTTLGPTCRFLESKAAEKGKSIKIIQGLADGAYQEIVKGNKEKHDRLILEKAFEISDKCDLIVLAQGSMARMEEQLVLKTGKIVLSSPLRAVLQIKELVEVNFAK